MVNLLVNLDNEIKEMIELSHQLGQKSEKLLWHSNLNSEFYDENKCEILRNQISKLQKRFFYLREKWLDVK